MFIYQRRRKTGQKRVMLCPQQQAHTIVLEPLCCRFVVATLWLHHSLLRNSHNTVLHQSIARSFRNTASGLFAERHYPPSCYSRYSQIKEQASEARIRSSNQWSADDIQCERDLETLASELENADQAEAQVHFDFMSGSILGGLVDLPNGRKTRTSATHVNY